MENDIEERLKGWIPFPCGCKANVFAYEDARGRISTACPVCGKFCSFYPEEMTAAVSGPVKGAIRKLKMRGSSPSRLGP